MLLSIHNIFKNITILRYKHLNRLVHEKLNNVPIESSYTAVYRFPYIHLCSVVNKCKKIQLGFLAITLPTSYASYLADVCGAEIPFIVSAVGLASTVALFSIGQFLNRLIGYVYISRNHKQVKLAYIDFWGKRQDIICNTQDIKPFKDKISPKDFFYKTVIVSTSMKPFKINLSTGEILQYSVFKEVFKYDVGGTDYSYKAK